MTILLNSKLHKWYTWFIFTDSIHNRRLLKTYNHEYKNTFTYIKLKVLSLHNFISLYERFKYFLKVSIEITFCNSTKEA